PLSDRLKRSLFENMADNLVTTGHRPVATFLGLSQYDLLEQVGAWLKDYAPGRSLPSDSLEKRKRFVDSLLQLARGEKNAHGFDVDRREVLDIGRSAE